MSEPEETLSPKPMKKRLILLLTLLHIVVCHQAWAQHNLLISDPFFEGDSIYLEKKTLTIQEYQFDEDFPLVKRLNTLSTDCRSRSALKGYRIFFVEYNENDSVMQQHVFVSQIVAADQIDSEHLKGVFYLDQTPFYIFNLPKDTRILTPTDKTTSLQLVINRNEIFVIVMTMSNQLDGIIDVEKQINYQGLTYAFHIEYCQAIKHKRKTCKSRP
jgi:hypothetical protein